MSARKSSHRTIFLIVSSGSPLALIASSLRSISKKPVCPRSFHPPMVHCNQRVRFAATWREEFFEVPIRDRVIQTAAKIVLEPSFEADFEDGADRQGAYSDEEIAYWFFNPQKLSVHFPEFDYGAYRDRYACSGTFFFRRGAMNLAAYQQAWTLQQEDSDLFFFGEMGIWNFLVFHGVQKNELRVHNMQFQVVPV